MDIKEMKKDLLEYGLYDLVDGAQYGDYLLNIYNGNDEIIIVVYDDQGSAAGIIIKEEFLNIDSIKELEKHINAILYYNYIEHEGE